MIVAQRMWQRRDSAANWTSVNPVMAAGEIGVELGSPIKVKVGDGVTAWTGLPYLGDASLGATLAALEAADWAANAVPIGSGADTLAQVAFAANTFPARASTGNLAAKPVTDFGLSLVDDADATAARTTLGLGTAATTAAADYATAAQGAAVAGKEPTIAAGTTAQFWRGDKAWSNELLGSLGIGMTPDRPFALSTAGNPLAAGQASFLIVGDANKERLEMRASGGSDPIYQGKRASNTAASPTATSATTTLVALGGSGHDGTDWVSANKGLVSVISSEAWSGTAQGCRIVFGTTQNTTTTRVDRWEVASGGSFRPMTDNTFDLGSASQRVASTYSRLVYFGAGTTFLTSGSGTPEGVVVAPVGSLFTRTDGGATTTLYVKTSGSGNTGWTAK